MVTVRIVLVVVLLVAIPAPAQAASPGRTAIAVVNSIGRDAAGRLMLDVTVRVIATPGNGCSTQAPCRVALSIRDANTGGETTLSIDPDATGLHFVDAVFATKTDAVRGVLEPNTLDPSYGPWTAVTDMFPKPSLTAKITSIDRNDRGDLAWDVTVGGRYLSVPGAPCQYWAHCIPGIMVRYADSGGTESLDQAGDFGDGNPGSQHFAGSRGVRQIDAIRPYLYQGIYDSFYGDWVPVTDEGVPAPFATIAVDNFSRDNGGDIDYDLTVRGKYLAAQSEAACSVQCFAGVEARYADDPHPQPLMEPVDVSGNAPFAKALAGSATPVSASPILAIRAVVSGYNRYSTYSDWIPVSGNVRVGHDLDAVLTLITTAVGTTSGSCLMLFPVGTHAGGSSLNDQQLACESAVLTAGKSFTAYVAGYLKTLSSKQIARLLVTAGIHTAENTAKVSPDLDYGKTLPAGCLWTSIRTISCTNAGTTTTFSPISAPPQQDFLYQANQFAKSKQANSDITIPPVPEPGITSEPTDHAQIDDYRVLALDTCEVQIVQTEETDDLDADDCTTMPIFFTGTDVQEATNHDYDVIQAHPELMQLTYVKGGEKGKQRPNWAKSPECGGKVEKGSGKECDEFPFFSTEEGYPDHRPDLRVISDRENKSQGGSLSRFFQGCTSLQSAERGSAGRYFLVVPWVLPTMSWCPK
jgi:hypothetical protein